MNNQYRTNDMFYNIQNQNLNIVKSYFKRTIVLASAILSAISFVVPILLNFISTEEIYNSMLSYNFNNVEINTSSLPVLNINVFSILGIIATFLLYFKSRKNDSQVSLDAPIILKRVTSIATLVGVCILTALFLIFCVALLIGLNHFTSYVGYGYVFLILAVFAVIIASIMFNAISGVIYWKSIKKSLNTTELTTKGVKAYAISNVILAVVEAIIIPLLFVWNIKVFELYKIKSIIVFTILIAVIIVLSVANSIIEAIIAFGYNRYIKYQKNIFAFIPEVPDSDNVDLNRPIGYSFNEDTSVKATTTNEIDGILKSLDNNCNANIDNITPNNNTTVKNVENVVDFEYIAPEEQDIIKSDFTTKETISKSGISMDISSMDITQNPFANNDNVINQNANIYTNGVNNNDAQINPNFCHLCGNKLESEHIYCNRCGRKIK